jgi:hypothetical protein
MGVSRIFADNGDEPKNIWAARQRPNILLPILLATLQVYKKRDAPHCNQLFPGFL